MQVGDIESAGVHPALKAISEVQEKLVPGCGRNERALVTAVNRPAFQAIERDMGFWYGGGLATGSEFDEVLSMWQQIVAA